jgi:major membrane immunogen (membrane-anchored lipoprotein)
MAKTMQKGLALVAAAAFLSAGLAGCSSGDKSGFSVKAPSAPGGEYVFTANGSADNYTWDLGDRLTVAYGKSVHHTYDFKNGAITVTLTAKKGAQSEESRQALTLGTGQNAQPTFILEGQTNWTVTGETVRFSAAKSTDPDGDPLRYTWSCVRTGDAKRQPTHTHPGFGGVPFATPPAGTVTAQNAVGALPTPDRKPSGDLCEALGNGGKPSKDTTIEGAFTKTGIYDIYLLASDPVHPTTSGKYHFAVTTPDERPAKVWTQSFSGNLQGGSNGVLQGVGDQAGSGQRFDEDLHTFTLPLTGFQGWAATTVTPTLQGADAGSTVTWTLSRGTVQVAAYDGTAANVTLPAAEMKASGYTLRVDLQGAGASYTVDLAIPLDLDPFKVY